MKTINAFSSLLFYLTLLNNRTSQQCGHKPSFCSAICRALVMVHPWHPFWSKFTATLSVCCCTSMMWTWKSERLVRGCCRRVVHVFVRYDSFVCYQASKFGIFFHGLHSLCSLLRCISGHNFHLDNSFNTVHSAVGKMWKIVLVTTYFWQEQ